MGDFAQLTHQTQNIARKMLCKINYSELTTLCVNKCGFQIVERVFIVIPQPNKQSVRYGT